MIEPATAGLAVLALSSLDFAVMAWDKFQAVRGARRVPELGLHALELCGGWPGGLLAMALLRHKSRKPAFWVVTGAIAVLHLVLVGLWIAAHPG